VVHIHIFEEIKIHGTKSRDGNIIFSNTHLETTRELRIHLQNIGKIFSK